MNLQLAKTAFLTGPRDDLAVVDVFARETGNVVNSIQAITSLKDLDLRSILRGGTSALNSLAILKSNVKGVLNMSKENLVARLLANSGAISAAVKNLSPGVLGQINAAMPGASEVFATVGGVVRKVQTESIETLNQLGESINAITGNKSLFSLADRDGTAGLYAGLVQEANALGLPGSYRALMSAVEDPYIINRVSCAVLPSVIANSDLDSLSAMASRMSPGALAMAQPDVLGEFARRYTAPPGQTAQQQGNAFTQVLDTFTKVSSTFTAYSRLSPMQQVVSAATDITGLQGASRDFQQLLQVGARLAPSASQKIFALSAAIPPTTVGEQLARQFPRTVVGAVSAQRARVVDPRMTDVVIEQGSVVTSTGSVKTQDNYVLIDGVRNEFTKPASDNYILIDGVRSDFVKPAQSQVYPQPLPNRAEEEARIVTGLLAPRVQAARAVQEENDKKFRSSGIRWEGIDIYEYGRLKAQAEQEAKAMLDDPSGIRMRR